MPHNDLVAAQKLVDQGNLNAAAEMCRDLLLASPDDAAALRLLARIGRKSGNFDAAERLLRSSLARCSAAESGEFWFELGYLLRTAHRLRDAAEAYEQAVSVAPHLASAWTNLAALYGELEQHDDALRSATRAVELAPESPLALINLSEVMHARREIDGMIEYLDRALVLDPLSAQAHWNLASGLLLKGDFARGWDHYAWRERTEQVAIDHYPQPRWIGGPLDGQTMLIHGEQGVGDEILFSSCYDELVSRAAHCVVVCDKRLEPLFRRSFPNTTVVGYQRRKDRQPAPVAAAVDWQLPSGCVPRYFRRQPADFPQRERFLQADPAQVALWRRRLGALGPSLKVGISWRAGGQSGEHRRRSINLALWHELFAIPGIEWINLQYGYTSDERAWAQSELGVTIHDWPEADPLSDLDACAAQISALDLVVSCDNTTVHLAGALGVPTWVFVPYLPSWRWGLSGDRSCWYSSLRLARQEVNGQWEPLLHQLAEELRDLAAARNGHGQESAKASKANSNRKAGNATSAPRSLAPAPEMLPEIVDIHATLRQAKEADQQGRTADAERLCRLVLCLSPRQVHALRFLSQLAWRSGRSELAIDALTHCLEVQANPDGLLELADMLAKTGRREEAIAQLNLAIALVPDLMEARHAIDRLRAAAAPAPLSGVHWGTVGARAMTH